MKKAYKLLSLLSATFLTIGSLSSMPYSQIQLQTPENTVQKNNVILNNVRYFQQTHTNTCGPTSMQMALNSLGFNNYDGSEEMSQEIVNNLPPGRFEEGGMYLVDAPDYLNNIIQNRNSIHYSATYAQREFGQTTRELLFFQSYINYSLIKHAPVLFCYYHNFNNSPPTFHERGLQWYSNSENSGHIMLIVGIDIRPNPADTIYYVNDPGMPYYDQLGNFMPRVFTGSELQVASRGAGNASGGIILVGNYGHVYDFSTLRFSFVPPAPTIQRSATGKQYITKLRLNLSYTYGINDLATFRNLTKLSLPGADTIITWAGQRKIIRNTPVNDWNINSFAYQANPVWKKTSIYNFYQNVNGANVNRLQIAMNSPVVSAVKTVAAKPKPSPGPKPKPAPKPKPTKPTRRLVGTATNYHELKTFILNGHFHIELWSFWDFKTFSTPIGLPAIQFHGSPSLYINF